MALSTVPINGRQINSNLTLGDTTTAATITLKGGGTNAGTFILEGKITCQDIVVASGVLTTLETATITTDLIIGDELNVNGNTRLGNSATDITDINGALAVNMAGGIKLYNNSVIPVLVYQITGSTGAQYVGGLATFAGDILPVTAGTQSIGSVEKPFKAVLADSIIGTSEIGGTKSEMFTIDSDNTGGDLALRFGATLNEQLKWNNTAGRFEFTDDLYIPLTLTVDGNSTLNGNLQLNAAKNITIYDNSGTPVKVFEVLGASGATTVGALATGTITTTGNIVVTGTVDGVDIAGASIDIPYATVTETPNGSIANFHLASGYKYLANKARVYVGCLRQVPGNQYIEDADKLGITFTTGNIPATGELVWLDYIRDIS